MSLTMSQEKYVHHWGIFITFYVNDEWIMQDITFLLLVNAFIPQLITFKNNEKWVKAEEVFFQ